MILNKFKKVVVGLSGGVDSAVSAFLLKNNGFLVEGVYMKNWDTPDELNICNADHDIEVAKKVSEILNIKFREINFSKEYWNFVFNEFLNDYENGLTPNPDILCNRFIKFNYFFNYAREQLNADAIATGHYAQSSFGRFLENYNELENVKLLQAVDKHKDQTFFLSQINQSALRRTMFPIGHMLKSDVRELAKSLKLDIVSNKPDSTGICFIGKRRFDKFISEYLEDKPGVFIDIDSGLEIGKHKGIHYWTVGQRAKIGGEKQPVYIAQKNVDTQTIYVIHGVNHSFLFSKLVYLNDVHWINKEPDQLARKYPFFCKFRFQHTKPLVDCQIIKINENKLMIYLNRPLRAVTPGQFGIFYKKNECLGSARIISPGLSLFHLEHQNNINIVNEYQTH